MPFGPPMTGNGKVGVQTFWTWKILERKQARFPTKISPSSHWKQDFMAIKLPGFFFNDITHDGSMMLVYMLT